MGPLLLLCIKLADVLVLPKFSHEIGGWGCSHWLESWGSLCSLWGHVANLHRWMATWPDLVASPCEQVGPVPTHSPALPVHEEAHVRTHRPIVYPFKAAPNNTRLLGHLI